MMKKQLSSKKYISFFRLRFAVGLQYRSAALAGIFTQFMWGVMEIFDAITNGTIAYELIRPIDIYHMWFSRSMALRMA